MSDTRVLDRADGGAEHPTGLWHQRAALVRAPTDRTADDLLKLARKAAFDATIFEDAPPFFAMAVISNDGLDTYFTRMHQSTLKNYATDAADGVTVLASHNSRQLGIGRSLTGSLVRGRSDELSTVLSDFYTVPGLRLGDVSTDDVINGIRSGLLHDISVGFYGGTEECGLCGRSYWDRDCPHFGGVEFPVLDKQGQQTGTEVAFVWIKDAHLAEYSIVYDGATVGAEIVAVKARQHADAGRLPPEIARLLEERYRIRLPGTGHRYSGAGTAPPAPGEAEEVKPMPGELRAPAAAQGTTQGAEMLTPEHRMALEIRDVLRARAAIKDGDETVSAIRTLLDERDTLRPLAEEGRAYRADLIAAALAEGVRAFGETFDQDAYRTMLGTVPIDQVKRFAEAWAGIASAALPAGRSTEEPDDGEGTVGGGEVGARAPVYPAAAYRA